MIRISLENEAVVLRGYQNLSKQMAFGLAKTLTLAAKAGQNEIKAQLPRIFDRPTSYTMNSTYIKPATKADLSAEVGFREWAPKGTPAPKYLMPQVIGGGRGQKRFELALRAVGALPPGMFAMPGEGAKMDPYGNMSRGQIVDILSYLSAFKEVGYTANITSRTRRKRKSKYFVAKPGGHLHPGIYQRSGISGRSIIPVLIFTRAPHYGIRFRFYDIVREVAAREIKERLWIEVEDAIATAK